MTAEARISVNVKRKRDPVVVTVGTWSCRGTDVRILGPSRLAYDPEARFLAYDLPKPTRVKVCVVAAVADILVDGTPLVDIVP